MLKKKNILHLLSWFPTPNDPTAGNFCLKQILSVSPMANSVILSVYTDTRLSQKTQIEVIDYKSFKHILIHVSPSKFPLDKMARVLNKWRIFHAYNKGLKYVKKSYFIPDLLHLHVTLPVGKVAYYWWKRYKLPYILTEHWSIFLPQNNAVMTSQTLKNIRRIANHAQMILPVSEILKESMQQYGISAPFSVIPNVVNTEIFIGQQNQPHSLKRILHISTLSDEVKNFSGILRVILQLSKKRADFVLDVVHDYPKPEFEKYVLDHNLQDFVIFHGKREESEVAQFYAQSDFFVSFSNFETQGVVLLESFACGRPVIATQVGGVPEIVNAERGILIPAKDEDALLKSVEYMLDNYETFDKDKIRDYACRNFSREVIGAQINAVYEKVLGKKNKHHPMILRRIFDT